MLCRFGLFPRNGSRATFACRGRHVFDVVSGAFALSTGFMEVYKKLLAELLEKEIPRHEMPAEAIEHIRRVRMEYHVLFSRSSSHAPIPFTQMTDYNVPGGKLNRGLTVVHSLQALLGKSATHEQLEQAAVVGWCLEWLQACFLVADDVMDASETRRGQPCWYKVPGIALISINDSFILWSTLFVFLRNHFGTLPIYVPLVDLFNEVLLQTQLGQLLDLTSAPVGGPVDLDRFTLER